MLIKQNVLLLARRGSVNNIKSVFHIPLLNKHSMPAVSTRN